MRRILTLTSLAVVMVAVTTGSAFGAAKCRLHYPAVNGTTSATLTVSLQDFTFVADGKFRASRLGKGTYHLDGLLTTRASPFQLVGTFTFLSANGDTLTGTLAGTSADATSTTNVSTITYTVTGGTGRFVGAAGSLHATSDDTETIDTATLTAHLVDTGSLRGRIRYSSGKCPSR